MGLVLALLLLVLTACGGDSGAAGNLTAHRLDPPFQVATTALTDTDDKPFSLTKDTDHRLTMVFFGYTRCPDVCQLVMANLASAMTRLDDSDRKQVQVVFVTTDPTRDTGSVIRRWLDHIDPSFVGLTGPIDTIRAIAQSVAVGMGQKLPSGGYDVNAHSTQVTAIDSDDQAPLFWPQDTTSAQYAADIHTLLGKP